MAGIGCDRMPCYHPIEAYRNRAGDVVFRASQGVDFLSGSMRQLYRLPSGAFAPVGGEDSA